MSLSKHVASVLRASQKPVATRAFHSPFALLGTSPLTNPNPPSQEAIMSHYEKYYEHAQEPVSSGGYRTYVVSEPDHSSRHYQVPAGAYPTSAPYDNFSSTPAPEAVGPARLSSTSADFIAHGFTTRAATQHSRGAQASSGIRYASAPGEMGALGGSYGGAGVVDKQGTAEGTGSLGSHNPPPMDGKVAEKYSKAGLDGAWKLRK